MKTIEVSESALESLKAMAQKLQEERDMLLVALKNFVDGCSTTVDAFAQARAAIEACQENTKVLEQ